MDWQSTKSRVKNVLNISPGKIIWKHIWKKSIPSWIHSHVINVQTSIDIRRTYSNTNWINMDQKWTDMNVLTVANYFTKKEILKDTGGPMWKIANSMVLFYCKRNMLTDLYKYPICLELRVDGQSQQISKLYFIGRGFQSTRFVTITTLTPSWPQLNLKLN